MAAKPPSMSAPSTTGDDDGKVHDLLDYKASIESTLPPTPLKDLLAAGGATVYVLSTDETLVDIVQRAGGEQYPIFPLTSWEELAAAIQAGRCNIALLDADDLGRNLTRRLHELERYGGRLVVLVAAKREDSQELIGYLSERKIHRLLIKPAALGITRLLLESAVGRCLQLRDQGAAAEPIFAEDRRDRRKTGSVGRLPAWLLATGLASLVVGVLVVVGLRPMWQTSEPAATPQSASAVPAEATEDQRAPATVTPDGQAAADDAASEPRETPDAAAAASAAETEPQPAAGGAAPPATAATSAPADAPPDDRFTQLLASAAAAMAAGRLSEPPGDNALDYYLTILAADPNHAGARAELAVVIEALFTQAEGALLDDQIDLAAATLEHVRRAEPSSARLAFLEAQLQRSRARAEEEATAARVGPEIPEQGPEEELESLLTLAAARLGRGQLVAPAGDSASEYLERAAAISADDARVAALRTELIDAVAQTATAAVTRGNLAEAARLRAAAVELGAGAQTLAGLDRSIERERNRIAAERQAELYRLGSERLASGALIAPPEDNALHYFAQLRMENPQYPELAPAWDAITDTIAANARSALADGDWARTDTWLQPWLRAEPASAEAQAIAADLAAARRQQEYLATAVPASVLPLLEYEPPEYPLQAQRAGIEGWVDVEFVVGRDGRPRDIVVVAEEPNARFDEAAVEAVREYVYAPFELDGRIYERRVRLRLSFTLQ